MASPLPPATSFVAPTVTEDQFKSALTQMISYLSGLLGTAGDAASARAALGLSGVPLATTNRGQFAQNTAYNLSDVVVYNGVSYLNTSPLVSPASGGTPDVDTAHWTVWQGVTLTQLSSTLSGRDPLRSQAAYSEMQRENLVPRPQMCPTPEFITAVMSGVVTIVVVGDSISEGADTPYVNGWVQNFTEMLQIQIPWIDWRVINLSIGGRNLNNLGDPNYTSPGSFSYANNIGGQNSQAWPDGTFSAGMAWRDYVKYYAPDLIILSHQENCGTDTNALENDFNTFYNYSQTWTKKPWFTLVSTHLPTVNPNLNGGAWLAAQSGRQGLADWLRHTAIFKGFGLIDNNAIFRMMRDGVRREFAPFVVEQNARYWGDATKWAQQSGSAPTFDGITLTFPGTGLVKRLVSARDVDLAADFNPAAGSTTRFSYRMTGSSDTSGYSVQYAQATGVLTLYYGTTDLIDVNVPNPPAAGTSHNLRVKATGPWHEVFFNGKRLIRRCHGTGMFASGVLLGYAQGAGTVIRPSLCYASEAQMAPQYFNEQYILGNNPADVTTNPDSLGGDGIHHLSTNGVFLVYLPAVQRFINDLKRVLERPVILSTGRQGDAITQSGAGTTTIASHRVTVTIPVDKIVQASIYFGYQNTSANDGQLQLLVDNAIKESWYLPPTTATNPGNHNRPFSATIAFRLAAGTHTFDLAWGTDGVMSSGGGAGERYLSVLVLPS